MNQFRHWSRQTLIAGSLMLALLFVQTLGLLHGVAHGGGHAAGVAAASLGFADKAEKADSADPVTAESRLFDARHSCASFDAATMSVALQLRMVMALLTLGSGAPNPLPMPASAQPPAPCHFLSRAPPFLV